MKAPLNEPSTSATCQLAHGPTRWAASLENVLDDYDALQQFRAWMGAGDATDSSEHPLRLHFALLAYRERVVAGDRERAPPLAASIFNKFLRPRDGLCRFIDAAAREAVGRRIAALPPATDNVLPDVQLFAPCEPDLYRFLRQQHALFIRSREFLDSYNAVMAGIGPPAPCETPARRPAPGGAGKAQPSLPPPRLTANSLMRSQRRRESTFGCTGGEPRPVARYPYVGGRATTSKNDSAVSSSFSSDAQGSGYGNAGASQYYGVPVQPVLQKRVGRRQQRAVRDEQRRVNPAGAPPAPFVVPLAGGPAAASGVTAAPPDHSTTSGRLVFAKTLTDKLQTVLDNVGAYEECRKTDDTITDGIRPPDQRSDDSANVSLDAVPGAEIADELDADDDVVDAYYRRRVLFAPGAQDTSTLNSQQQTPPMIPMAGATSGHVDEPLDGPAGRPFGQYVDGATLMSQSLPGAGPAQISRSCVAYAPQQQQQQQLPIQEQQVTTSRQHPRKGFAPPPGKSALQCHKIYAANLSYCDNDCDTSGIGSMTYISDVPLTPAAATTAAAGVGPTPIPKLDRAAVFRRYREMAAGGGEAPATSVETITICCRSRGAGGVPLVAHVPLAGGQMTLKEFRRHLSISSREKKRFFFQTICDDGTAPYQMLMINDPTAVLPIFDGKISAECCSVSDSE